MKIYCARPISGETGEAVISYYTNIKKELQEAGYVVYYPMIGKNKMRTELEFKSHGYTENPLTSNHSIFERDKWMVTQADVVYANLTNTQRVSIGTVMELAWAAFLGKHTIVAMNKDDIHNHAFILEAADTVFETHELAINYLKELITNIE